jgi:hypothetical protein
LKGPTLRKEEQNTIAAHVIGPHPVILVNAGEAQYITIEGGSPVEVGNVQGSLKNSGQPGHA